MFCVDAQVPIVGPRKPATVNLMLSNFEMFLELFPGKQVSIEGCGDLWHDVLPSS